MKLRIILGCYVLFIILISIIPGSGKSFWHVDKIGHFLAYGGLIMLAFLTFPSKQSRLIAVLFAIGLGILLEWIQSFVPGREASFMDGAANTLGVFSGGVFFHYYGQVLVDWLKRQRAAYLFD